VYVRQRRGVLVTGKTEAGRTVLVTGGAGFIGSHLVDALLADGNRVVVVDDLSSGREENVSPQAVFHRLDICDGDGLMRICREYKPRYVLHQAAQISVSHSVRHPVDDARTNVMGLLNVLEAARDIQVDKLVFASSGGVLYGDTPTPAREDHPLAPQSPYGLSKMMGEKYLEFYWREYQLPYVALRYGNVYGPRQDPHGEAGVVAIFALQLLTGQCPTIFGDGACVRDYVFVHDVVRANLLSLWGDAAGCAINVGTGRGTDVNSLYRELAALIPGSPSPQYGPPRPGDLRASRLDPSRAKELLNWYPEVDLVEGLRCTVEWFARRQRQEEAGPNASAIE